MIASIAFRRFKALRHTSLALAPFNLVVGPNGSGKTSLIQALLQLRALARLPLSPNHPADVSTKAPEVTFTLNAPWAGVELIMACAGESRCESLQMRTAGDAGGVAARWPELSAQLLGVRAYLLDHYAMAEPAPRKCCVTLNSNGANLAAVIAGWAQEQPETYAGFCAEVLRLFPEYDELRVVPQGNDHLELALRLRGEGSWIAADGLSQGTLYGLALCALAHDPAPPPIVCIEELDRGLHPRLLRGVRDVIYRLSYPLDRGLTRPPVQVIATTHSPYLLDLFRDHPEEVVIAEKSGRAATFARLADRPDLADLLNEGPLGDLWYSGLLGGVPDDE